MRSLFRSGLAVPAAVLLFSGVVACGKSNAGSTGRTTAPGNVKPAATGKMLTAVGTTTQIADFLKNVGGNQIKVLGLVAANQDPHEFEPKPQDVQTLNSADIVFKNGIGLEANFAKFINGIPGSVPVTDVSRGVKLRKADKGDDPHIWHDPLNAKIMVNNIRDALSARDPSNAALYRQNAANYTQQLDQLDADLQKQIQAVPADKRKLISNHDAFGYFVARYGITFVGSVIPSLDTNAEPSAKDTEDLIKKIKDQHICAIFTESSINPKLEQRIASDAGVKVYSNLYGDTLGPPGSDGDTYLKMEASNGRNMIAGMRQSC